MVTDERTPPMSPCLIETGSPLSYLDPTLSIMAGFDSIQFEDQIAEQIVVRCQRAPHRVWQRSDLGDVMLRALQCLAPQSWSAIDSDLVKSLLVGTKLIAEQIVPDERRGF